jgi:dTDP-4-dehydrorhamnose reductase
VYICSGFTWVDGCESQPLHANHMNNAGPAAVAAAAKKVGAKTIW